MRFIPAQTSARSAHGHDEGAATSCALQEAAWPAIQDWRAGSLVCLLRQALQRDRLQVRARHLNPSQLAGKTHVCHAHSKGAHGTNSRKILRSRHCQRSKATNLMNHCTCMNMRNKSTNA
eukprot:TRINITY_DN74034_c0_g1_i1.p1 TRINITY_DN74034_c0_g1~~TRINITY_DN74034_c0_g1_i1.p1  ORF type:complete len:120 (-),score=8.52 TRINITY_DN74034_c0_g1_i1:2-361(-)